MPTLTLTLDADLLDALTRGEAVALTATLRARKPKTGAPLTPEQEGLYKGVQNALGQHAPSVSIARVWKAIKERLRVEPVEDVLYALDACLDWCKEGGEDKVYYFAQDYPAWLDRARIDLIAAEDARTAWRRGKGLPT